MSCYEPVRLAVVNPQQKYILQALEKAETKNWIKPLLFKNNNVEKALSDSIAAVQNGKADLLMKGNIDTATLLKAIINKRNGLLSNKFLSHIAVLESPNYKRLMLTTDGGVNTTLSENLLNSIIENALQVTHALKNNKPNIAMLALIEKVSEKLPETVLARKIVERYKNDSRFIIEGPIALDVALSLTAAKAKKISSRIAGKTDIFIGPNITATNFISKMLLSVGNSKGGGIIIGAKIPIILLSRSDTMETKLNSIALGLSIYHNQLRMRLS
ncbi:MAG: phosphate butyryltransferase [Planctomycetia bacterium]|nr:phosphate butyryltransferase [Planctomycetia bacterium]